MAQYLELSSLRSPTPPLRWSSPSPNQVSQPRNLSLLLGSELSLCLRPPWPKPLRLIITTTGGGFTSQPQLLSKTETYNLSRSGSVSPSLRSKRGTAATTTMMVPNLSSFLSLNPSLTLHIYPISLSLKPRTQLLDLLPRRAPYGAWNMNRCRGG